MIHKRKQQDLTPKVPRVVSDIDRSFTNFWFLMKRLSVKHSYQLFPVLICGFWGCKSIQILDFKKVGKKGLPVSSISHTTGMNLDWFTFSYTSRDIV